MTDAATLHEALIVACIGAVFALITIRLRPDFRKGMFNMVLFMLVGVVGVVVLAGYGDIIASHTIGVTLRELCLLIITIGFARTLIVFVVQGLLSRRAIPNILGDVVI